MRKLLFFLSLQLLMATAFAQASSDSGAHLSFHGIQIDGKHADYVSKLKQIGFNHISTTNGTAMLEGDFGVYKDCKTRVATLDKKDLVYKINILFTQKKTWSALSANYFDLKQMLTAQYGIPAEVQEKFESRSQPRYDKSKMYEVGFDRCKYYSIWKLANGEIQLSIDHIDVFNCFVRIAYIDKINGATVKKIGLDKL